MSRQSLRGRRWAWARRKVLDRDGWACVQCGKRTRLEVDHVRPLDRGGSPYGLDNLQTLCGGSGGCHAAKTAREQGRKLAPREAEWKAHLRSLARNDSL